MLQPVTARLEIGVIARPHGREGQLRVKLWSENPTLLTQLRQVWLCFPDGRDVSAN